MVNEYINEELDDEFGGMVMSFIKGIELCRRFHMEIVEPVMTDSYSFLSYSSALMGPGSEVLGYDTEMSTDHDWVPRTYLFLNHQDVGYSEQIRLTPRESSETVLWLPDRYKEESNYDGA
jgi:hypothetical protein